MDKKVEEIVIKQLELLQAAAEKVNSTREMAELTVAMSNLIVAIKDSY